MLSPGTWRVNTQGAKRDLIEDGHGWGRLPSWQVAAALTAGRLRRLGVGGGREPAVLAGDDELRDARDIGRDHRLFKRHRLHDRHGQSFGVTRQYESAGAFDFAAHLARRLPSGDDDAVGDIVGARRVFDDAAHGAVADQADLESAAFALQQAGGLDQRKLAFLLAEPADADENGFARLRNRAVVERLFDAAMDDFYPSPEGRIDDPTQLADAVAGNADDEARALDLARKRNQPRLVEFFGAVNGHAEARAGDARSEERDCRRIGAEMRVDMAEIRLAQPFREHQRFEPVDLVAQKARFRAPAETERRPERAERARRRAGESGDRLPRERDHSDAENVAGADGFLLIFRGEKFFFRAAHGEPRHLDAAPLQRLDLATHESMADARILIDQVGDAHRPEKLSRPVRRILVSDLLRTRRAWPRPTHRTARPP